MELRKAMLSMLQLFAGFLFFAAAIFFFLLPSLPNVRLQISNHMVGEVRGFTLLGTVLMVISFLLIGGFYVLNRGRSLTVKMGTRATGVHVAVIKKTLEECFKHHFGGQILLSDLAVVRGNQLEIEVLLVPFEENLREDLFVAVQNHVGPL